MTLDEVLLEKLAKWRPDSARQTLDVAHPETGWTTTLTADCVDALGCRLWEVGLRPAAPPAADLRTRAEGVAARVTGLLEPLRLVEVDQPRNVALLRSGSPAQRGDDLHYYEVLIHGDGNTSVRRYQSSHQAGARREQVPFTLTHETLAKFVTDLAG